MSYNSSGNWLLERGMILDLSGGVARVSGLGNAGAGEMVLLGSKSIGGMVLSLENKWTSVVIFGNDRDLKQGDWVLTTGIEMSVPIGDFQLNAVVDPLGWDVTKQKTKMSSDLVYMPVDSKAAGVIKRQPVSEPLQTGIQLIDTLIPIGCGQRELIIGDRQTGKTAVAVDSIINQTNCNTGIYWIYVAVGQKRSSIVFMFKKLRKLQCSRKGIVVLSSSDDSAALQYLAPYSGCTIGEWFTNAGAKVLIVYDDLSKQAVAYRQISLLLRRPPGREAFPGDVFYLHSRLLERAAKLNINQGGGSLTAFPVVETQAGDVAAFIPTNVISITDGQIYLDKGLFNKGVRPAIDFNTSVSRVGSKAQVKSMKTIAIPLRAELSRFKEIEILMKFGSAIDKATLIIMERGLRLTELLKQHHSKPLSVKHQVLFINSGINGILDYIETSQVSNFKLWLINYIEQSNLLRNFDVDGQINQEVWLTSLEESIKAYTA